ncbi:unnamed protein product [Microthlaspi erraticum]|uniref:Retrovirus-related Pol polyprotein from transposon TNT 1-94-like beta-barrel domain-containing protein n=1 Tax=Microthlaspi erraticum TaxID=1685480 RepID=A0A6D2IGQ0_9BRAS|nr:unnamed protein product [Microthlaspi erraticum]
MEISIRDLSLWSGFTWFCHGSNTPTAGEYQVHGINGQTSEVPNPDYHVWLQTDHIVKSWLIGTFTEEVLALVIQCATSRDMWLSVANHFNKISSARLYELQCRLQDVAKKGRPMVEFLNEITAICSLLQSVGHIVPEQIKIFTALRGLGPEYESVKASIEGDMDKITPPTFIGITPRLMSAEARYHSYTAGSEVSPHMAFNTMQVNYTTRGRGQSYAHRGRGRGYTTRGRGFPQQVSSLHGQITTSEGELKLPCQICGKKGHRALACWHRFDNAYQEEEMHVAMSALHITDITDHTGHEWYPDTGASAHVTSSAMHLQQSQPYSGSDSVMVADGNFLPITHTGSTVIGSTSGTLPLKDVLVCPDIAKSLLSVSKVTRDYPYTFKFDCDEVVVKDKVTKKHLLVGRNNDEGLYKLKDSKPEVFFSSRQ